MRRRSHVTSPSRNGSSARRLGDRALEPDQQLKAAAVIRRNAESLAHLVDDLLDTSRIVTGKIRLHLELCDVAGLLRESLDMVRRAIDAKNLRLETSIGGPQLLLADCDRLRQVLWNLFTNAVKFTPSGGLVAVTLERVDAHIRITVRDTGIGIRRQAIPYIFQRFWQAENTTTRERGGLGLGLALSRYLVELHGGSIAVESAGPGMGAEFRVELPARQTLKPGDFDGGSTSLDRLSNDRREDSATGRLLM